MGYVYFPIVLPIFFSFFILINQLLSFSKFYVFLFIYAYPHTIYIYIREDKGFRSLHLSILFTYPLRKNIPFGLNDKVHLSFGRRHPWCPAKNPQFCNRGFFDQISNAVLGGNTAAQCVGRKRGSSRVIG